MQSRVLTKAEEKMGEPSDTQMDLDSIKRVEINKFIYKVVIFIRTLEVREMKAKEIETMLSDIKFKVEKCWDKVRKIFNKKMSIVKAVVTKKKTNEIYALLSIIKSKKGLSLAKLIKIFSEETKKSQELSKYLPIEMECTYFFIDILKNLVDLQKKFDEIETELRETEKTLIELHVISLIMGFEKLDNPAIAQRLNEAEQHYCNAVNIGNVFTITVVLIQNRKQDLYNRAMQINNKLLYI